MAQDPLFGIEGICRTRGRGLVLVGNTVIATSPDDGATWRYIATEGIPPLRGLVRTGQALVTYGRGVLRSLDDGATWQPGGKLREIVWSIASDGEVVFLATSKGVRRSLDGGASWVAARGGDGAKANACAVWVGDDVDTSAMRSE